MSEIRKKQNVNKINSSTFRLCRTTKIAYTVIETDNKEDFKKLLSKWPINSFDCKDQVVATREYLELTLNIYDVDLKWNFDNLTEIEQKTIENLKSMGIVQIKRATRYDHQKNSEQPTNRLECKIRDLEALKINLTNDIGLDCTQKSHQIEIQKENVKFCKNCCKIGHRTKGCTNLKVCAKCALNGHVIIECKNHDKFNCINCNLKHEAGTNRCRKMYEENYKLNM